MKEQDKRQFASLMRRLKVMFPSNLDPKDEALRAEIYWEEFKDYSIGSFQRAITEAIGSCTFFPKPAELKEFLHINSQIDYEQRLEEIKLLENNNHMPIEKVQKMVHDIIKKMDKVLTETLEGKEAEEFEKNREIAKEKAKRLVN